MNPEDLKFKDKDIEKITTDLKKENRKQFGETFKSAATRLGTDEAPTPPIGNPISNRIDQLAPKPTVISSLSDDSQLTPEKKELYSIVKPLRTYERDVAETIRQKNESVASVNIAAQEKKIERVKKGKVIETVEKTSKKGLILVLSIVLLLGGIGVAGFLFTFFANQPTVVVQGPAAIITTDSKQNFDTTNKTEQEIISGIQNLLAQPMPQNKLTRIDITENISNSPRMISSQKFFEILAKDAPSSLGRALGEEWIFGSHALTKSEPFIFTSVSSFDNAYDGMIRFEKNIAKNFAPIFLNSNTVLKSSTSTISQFEDLVIRNKDTRVLRDSSGNIVLLYSFMDTKTLVITTNENTYRELLGRFFASQIVR